jgi:hypothetical protein
METRTRRWLFALALVLAVVPLWVGGHLPMVDLPQHLMLISALHRLHDPTTLYPQLFELRPELTPYLGYYWVVALLNWVVPLTVANKLFLSAYVVGMPLGLAFLLRSLGRPAWPALLAIPFAYGDSFAWGFINYVAALPLAFLSLGLFARAIADAPRRRRWGLWHAPVLVAVLLFHVQVFGYLAFALPFLLLTTRAPEDVPGAARGARLRARLPAVASVVPGVALFLIWVVGRVGAPQEIEPGVPWKAWGPMLSAQNLSFKSFAQNRAELFSVLANQLRDGSDRYAVYLAFGLAAAAALLALFKSMAGQREKGAEGPVERWRMLGLSLIALALFFTLPFDIRGYVYYLNTRFAHLWAALLVAAAPALTPRLRTWTLAACALLALVVAVSLARGFAAFDREARPLDALAAAAPTHPLVMGLIYDTGSRVVRHPVFLHAATVVARLRGGATNFTFALTPHSPLRYQHTPPPTFPSEWRPQGLDFDTMAGPYDAFLIRGPPPSRVFGARLGSTLRVAAHLGELWLVVRR